MEYKIIKPNDNLKKLDFSDEDIFLLNTILYNMSNHLDNLVIEENIDETTSVGDVIRLLIINNKIINLFDDLLLKRLVSINTNSDNTFINKYHLFLNVIGYNSLNLNIPSNIYSNISRVCQDIKLFKSLNYSTLLDSYLFMIINYKTKSKCFNIMKNVNKVYRSGYLLSNVPKEICQRVGEHMYNMSLICNTYLPNNVNKDHILKMCLLHDVSESIIGDIPSPKKTRVDELLEDLYMQSLLLNLIKEGVDEYITYYDLWIEFTYNLTLDANICHDIDLIEMYDTLLSYALLYPDIFTFDILKKWFRRLPKTLVGKKIYNEVLQDNISYKCFIGIINHEE